MIPVALITAAALSVTVQGDSLTVSSGQYIKRSMPNHRIYVDARVGVPTTWGIKNLRELKKDGRLGHTVVFALGTNDDKNYPGEFDRHIREVRKIVGKGRCLVIPSIVVGGPIRAFNNIIHRYADVISPWVLSVFGGPVDLVDGVHPTFAGQRYRGRMIARSIRKCERLKR